MNVVILIGNGFDLALGLKTRYKDFLQKYRLLVTDAAVIRKMKEIIEDDRKNGMEKWSYAEEAFGRQKFSQYGEDVVSVLDDCTTDFQGCLCKYLEQEEQRFEIPLDRATEIRREFRAGIRRLISTCKALTLRRQEEPTSINFIDFNYTRTLDELLKEPKTPPSNVAIVGRAVTGPRFGMPCHVHGTLRLKNTLFGVDSASQIADDKLRTVAGEVGYLVKSQMDVQTGVRQGDVAERMIDAADLIIVFGMSYGKTDGRWWTKIIGRISTTPNVSVVLCPYVKELPDVISCVKKLRVIDLERRQFLSAVRPSSAVAADSHKERILVMGYGPYPDHDNRMNPCDPIGLTWIKEQCTSD